MPSDVDESRRKRKIEKLEKKLAKYRKKEKHSKDERGESSYTPELDPECLVSFQGPQGTPDPDNNPDIDVMSVEKDVSDDLDSDILMALGETSSGEKQYGENIHEEIFNTIKGVLTDGLPKQHKEKILESLLIPSNCKLLDAPKLNMELVGVMNNPSKTRDNLLQDRQQEMGLAIASVCQIINTLSKKDFDKLSVIKKLSDVSRVLSNLHYQYTEIRRKLCNPFLDKNLAESLKENKREAFLYSDLNDSVKSFSALKRTTNTLKPKQATQSKPATKNYQNSSRRPYPNQAPPVRGSFRGGAPQRYHQPRQPFKPQDNRPSGPIRGRAKYP